MMLAIHRAISKRTHHLITRSFAEVVGTSLTTAPPTSLPRKLAHPLEERIAVKDDHGLYAFFRRKEDQTLSGEAKYEVVESPESMTKQTGRAWKASELRLKSFRDLHTLWYILLRERNLLATQKEEARRMGVTATDKQVSLTRVYHCRKSMARIKVVLNERRLAYEGAIGIVEAEKEETIEAKVQKYLVKTRKEERPYLRRRREYKARRLGTTTSTVAEIVKPVPSETNQESIQQPTPVRNS